MEAQLIASAARPDQFPPECAELPEIAFLGRSNVGKSSLLNCLAREKGLAFTSARPGRTQLINFFEVGGGIRFVDLPGYGFARAPLEQIAGWKVLVDAYLTGRQSLALSFLILDARRGWMEKDFDLKQWLEHHNRRYAVIATKMDKLKSQQQRNQGLAQIRKQCADHEPTPFSAIDGRGVREIWKIITTIKTNP